MISISTIPTRYVGLKIIKVGIFQSIKSVILSGINLPEVHFCTKARSRNADFLY